MDQSLNSLLEQYLENPDSSVLDNSTLVHKVTEFLQGLKGYERYKAESLEDLRRLSGAARILLFQNGFPRFSTALGLYDLDVWIAENARIRSNRNGFSPALLEEESHFFVAAAWDACRIYSFTLDLNWAEVWYDHALTAAITAWRFHRKTAVEYFGIAGDAAFELYGRTAFEKQQKWFKRATSCYDRYLEYQMYNTNRDHETYQTIEQRRLSLLQV